MFSGDMGAHPAPYRCNAMSQQTVTKAAAIAIADGHARAGLFAVVCRRREYIGTVYTVYTGKEAERATHYSTAIYNATPE
jgi:hypothetical protein